MPDPSAPTKLQTLILWAVIARGGEAPQKGLKPEVSKPNRDALVARRLLASRPGPRGSILLEVTEDGWAWAAANMGAPLPGNSSSGSIVLQELLGKIGCYLQSSGVRLAELFAPPAAAPAEALAARIRAAYLAETGGHVGRRARLSALRGRLADVTRPALDAALLAFAQARSGVLMPLEDPAERHAADEAAALDAGGRRLHLLLLER